MPDYYKKFKPNCVTAFIAPDKMIVPNPKLIDFNLRKGTKWIAQGLGNSELIIRSFHRNNILIESYSNTEELSLLKTGHPLEKAEIERHILK